MAYDSARQRTVLFGGEDAASRLLDDTWEWNGTIWTTQLSRRAPPPLRNHAMAYDAVRQRVVLFGGGSITTNTMGETWEWDGTDWLRKQPTVPPPARAQHAMAYDPVRQRVVLAAGYGTSGQNLYDTWEWDGTTWTQPSLVQNLNPCSGFYPWSWMAYDAARQRMMLAVSCSETWLLGATIPARVSTYGVPCGGAPGTPALRGFGQPSLGNPSFALDLDQALPLAPGAHALALSAANLPLGSCSVLVDPATLLAVPAAVNASGFASLRLSIPSQTAWIGATVYAQTVVVDPGSPAGIALSNGLQVLVGD